MTVKGNQGQGRTEGMPGRNPSDATHSQHHSNTPAQSPQVSHAEDSSYAHPDAGAAAGTARAEGRRRSKRRGVASTHLQTIGLIAAILTIPLAYWQGRVQSYQSAFEKNQRMRELALNLASFWETQLDPETRYMAGRFVAKLKALPNDEERSALVRALLNSNNLLNSDAVLNNQENRQLHELIQADLGSPTSNVPALTPVMAVARYKAAVMRVLNTMEAIAIIREYSKGFPEAQEVIDRAYSGAIRRQYENLKPFLQEYQRQTGDVGWPAWELLIKMVDKAALNEAPPPPVARR